MEKRMKIAIIGLSSVFVIIFIVLGITIAKNMTPSHEVMLLKDYYQVEDSQVMLILQDEIYSKKGMLIDGNVYIDYDTVVQKLNHRFYWDKNENVLTYTTPTEILQAEAGKSEYTVTKTLNTSDKKTDYPIVKVFADEVYIALKYVEKYSDISTEIYPSPNRVIINYKWGDCLYTQVKKATQLRLKQSIKSPIIENGELAVGTELMYVNTEEAPKNGFVKVMTKEGIIGYVKGKHVKKSYYKTLKSSFTAPEYTAQTRPGKVNLVFHQVSNEDSNAGLEKLIKATKGVTVVAPTWFSISDVSGSITSLASREYISKAKELGLEVWALVDNFKTDVSTSELLSHTSGRKKLSDELIKKALDYNLNGLNIDFEKIPTEAGNDYIEFLRELSVKCRNNGLVLSVDDYVPAPYNEHYDLQEQGQILDYVIIMAYDEYYSGSEEAGPNSSIEFVTNAVNNTLAKVPKEKTVIAIPFYTRLWKEADGKLTSETLSMSKAAQVLKDDKVEAKWDSSYGCYYVSYKKDGATYKMWQEEDKSIEEKIKVLYGADVAGVAAWRLGLEKESIWDVIIKYMN